MPRTVTSCHVLPLSAEDYLLIRGDPTYEAYKADLVHQDLHITKLRSGADERADPTRWRSVEVHFRENAVGRAWAQETCRIGFVVEPNACAEVDIGIANQTLSLRAVTSAWTY